MSQGVTGTYAINGTELLLQPSEHGWVEREVIGYTGNAKPTYPGVRQFELGWSLMAISEWNQLQGFFEQVQQSGTLVVDLPKYGVNPYQFFSYSGCQIQEPTVGKFFVDYVTDVKLLILKVRT